MKLLFSATLLTLSSLAFADAPGAPSGNAAIVAPPPSFSSGNFYYTDPGTPDESEERTFTQESQETLNQIEQSGQNMINRDKNLYNQGYDPNQQAYPQETQKFQNQPDINNPYKQQEYELRGNQNGFAK